MKCLGKRFIFGIIAVISVSVTSILLHYTGEVYIKLVATIAALYLGGQTITDSRKKEVS